LASPPKIGFGLALPTLGSLILLNKLALICKFHFSGAALSGSRSSGVSWMRLDLSTTELAFFHKAKQVILLIQRASLASFRNFVTSASPAGAAADGTRFWAIHADGLRTGFDENERYLRSSQVHPSRSH